jgi:hypothetical protein
MRAMASLASEASQTCAYGRTDLCTPSVPPGDRTRRPEMAWSRIGTAYSSVAFQGAIHSSARRTANDRPIPRSINTKIGTNIEAVSY